MNIQKIPISQSQPATYNPRKDLKPGDPEYEKVKRSIQEFDLVEPLVWNKRTGNLVGGHQRLKVLQEMGVIESEGNGNFFSAKVVTGVKADYSKSNLVNALLHEEKVEGLWL